MCEKTALLALNGELKGDIKQYRHLLQSLDDFCIIAADGGALLLGEIELLPDVLIGDFDSLTTGQINYYEKNDVDIYRYSVEKDKTDAELALDYCVDNNFKRVIIIGATGGRFDQQLANIFLMEYALRKNLKVVFREPGLEAGLINKKIIVKQKCDFSLSLIPISNKVTGVSITGCKYELEKESLYRYKTRGISNLIEDNKAVIELEKGLLLYVLRG